MTIILDLIFCSLLLFVTASPPRLRPPHEGCTKELVAFSPCLSYIATPPNNATNTVTFHCCEAISRAFDSDECHCFCYLMRQPLIFGFPLNLSRVVSLPSVCNSWNASLARNSRSLDSVCSAGSPALPPLNSITGRVISNPSDSGPNNVTSPPPSFPTASAGTPTPPNLQSPSMTPLAIHSSATKHTRQGNRWLLLEVGLLASLAIFVHQ